MHPGGPEHAPFICNAWIGGMRGLFPQIDGNWLAAAQHSLIVRMLRTCRVDVVVAARPGDVSEWYGFVVGERAARIVHWVYVKEKFRDAGVANRLLDELLGAGARGEFVEVTTWASALRKFSKWQFVERSYRLCEAIRRSPNG
jgi:hypothetical protein